ncbi:phosphoribosyl transferase [Candidatus Uhrbacteria bacterium]|nr:MAG: phosphoribosyl transferase [Candidatus Uhrbacteria bacterium]
MKFVDRRDAGRKLAERLASFKGRKDVMLFALPRGGAVVGAEISQALGIPVDLIVTRKIGAPENEEYALGAMAETGEIVWNEAERKSHDAQRVSRIVEKEKAEAKRRAETYRSGRPLPDLRGKTALIVDDGLATGYTMRAAIAAAKHQHASNIVVAVPHGALDSIEALKKEADEVIALTAPRLYFAVGGQYDVFDQTEDEEVLSIMKRYGPKI